VKFLVDNQLPAALARWLTAQGADAQHVIDIGLDSAPDGELWSRAATDARIVVSKDEDFFDLANRPGDTGRLLWVRTGNCAPQCCSRTLRPHGLPSKNLLPPAIVLSCCHKPAPNPASN